MGLTAPVRGNKIYITSMEVVQRPTTATIINHVQSEGSQFTNDISKFQATLFNIYISNSWSAGTGRL